MHHASITTQRFHCSLANKQCARECGHKHRQHSHPIHISKEIQPERFWGEDERMSSHFRIKICYHGSAHSPCRQMKKSCIVDIFHQEDFMADMNSHCIQITITELISSQCLERRNQPTGMLWQACQGQGLVRGIQFQATVQEETKGL